MFPLLKKQTASIIILLSGMVIFDARSITFDINTLQALGYGREVADYFMAESRFLPGKQQVFIQVNAGKSKEVEAEFNQRGELCVDSQLLTALELKSKNLFTDCESVSAVWSEAQVRQFPGQFRIELTLPDDALKQADSRSEKGGSAVMLNYNVLTQRVSSPGYSTSYYSGNIEPGFNVNNWIIRNRNSFFKSEQAEYINREELSATRAIESIKSIFQVGEITARGESYSGLPITGLQLFSDGDQNDNLTLFTPIQGVAETNATVEIRQRSRLLYRTVVSPGPFSLSVIPGFSSGVPAEVSVIEDDGRRQRFTVNNLQSAGESGRNTGFQFGLGRYRSYFEAEDSAPPLLLTAEATVSPSEQLGLTSGALVSERYQNMHFSGDYFVSERLSLSGSGEISSVSNGVGGAQLNLMSNAVLSPSMSASLSGGYTSAAFKDVDTALANLSGGKGTSWQRHFSAGASLSWAHPGWGAWSFGSNWEQYHDGRRSLSQSFSHVRNIGIATLNMSLQKYNFRETALYLGLSLPLFGGKWQNTGQHINKKWLTGSNYNHSLGENASYNLSVDGDKESRRYGGSLNMDTAYSALRGSLSQNTEQHQATMFSASGGMAYSGGSFAMTSRRIGETFGMVSIPEQSGIRIQVPGVGSARTNFSGTAIIPTLPAYRDVDAAVDTQSLALNTRLSSTTTSFNMAKGSVAKRIIESHAYRQLLLTVRSANGKPVPVGSSVLDGDGRFLTTVVGDGNIMLVNDAIGKPLRVSLINQESCTVNYQAPETFDSDTLYEMVNADCVTNT